MFYCLHSSLKRAKVFPKTKVFSYTFVKNSFISTFFGDSMRRHSLLLIEADLNKVDQWSSILEQIHPFDIQMAVKVHEGIQKLKTHKPDLILMNLDTLTDLETIRQTLDRFTREEIPFIACSRKFNLRNTVYKLNNSYTEFVPDPVSFDELNFKIKRLLHYVSLVGELKVKDRKLDYQARLEQLISNFSARFAGTSDLDIDPEINQALESLGRFVGASRSSLFIVSEDQAHITNTHEWCADAEDSQIQLLQHIPFDTFGHHERQLKNFETISISKLSDYPPEAVGELNWAMEHGFRSLLFVPLIRQNILMGTLGFYGAMDERIEWPSQYSSLLRHFGNLFVNVLERKHAEQELKGIETRFHMIVDNMGEGVSVIGENETILFANRRLEEMFGYDSGTLMGQHVSILNADMESAAEEIYESVAKMGGWKGIIKNRKKDGSLFDSEVTLNLFEIEGEKLYVTIQKDVTGKLQNEQYLKESRQKLAFHIENSLLGAIEFDNDFVIRSWNPAAENIFGYKREEIVGIHTGDYLVPEEKRDQIVSMISNLEKGRNFVNINENLTKSGKRIICKWFNVVLENLQGEVIGSAGLCQDITEETKAEEELKSSQKLLQQKVEERTHQLEIAKDEAEHANRLKSEFLANISHELRTPMHAILNYSRYGISKTGTKPNDRIIQYFENINNSGKRLINLLNNLLDLSKLEANKIEYQKEQNSINRIIDQVVGDISPLLIDKDLRIVMLQTEDYTILCDKDKIAQVFINLLSNAVKFAEPNTAIEISLENNTEYLTTGIFNQGIPIPPRELDSIFDSFTQSSRTKTKSGGTGLGLAICQRIIEDHHGRIWAEQHDQGAFIKFTLPN